MGVGDLEVGWGAPKLRTSALTSSSGDWGGVIFVLQSLCKQPTWPSPFQLEQISSYQIHYLDALLVSHFAVLSVTEAGSPVANLQLLRVVKKGMVNV